ncbi:MAG: hypothetical protein ISR60_01340 [Anaerolineales bacterium]|nr:hypothetical protein [Anaerolineales bacterium]
MRKFIYPLTIVLLVLLTACNVVPESIAGNAVLGESIATEEVSVSDLESPDALPTSETAAESEAVEESADAEESGSEQPEAQDTPVAMTSVSRGVNTSMPVITDINQGLIYGPDQLVLVFAEGFQPGETVSVNAMHITEGIIKSISATANNHGQIVLYHYTQYRPEDKGAYPAGEITFRLRTSTGTTKTYSFNVDYEHTPEQTAPGCGSYPIPVTIGDAFAIWCGGFIKADYEETDWMTTYSIAHAGSTLLTANANVMADGLVMDWLNTTPGDPVGMWDITIGDQIFQIQVEE